MAFKPWFYACSLKVSSIGFIERFISQIMGIRLYRLNFYWKPMGEEIIMISIYIYSLIGWKHVLHECLSYWRNNGNFIACPIGGFPHLTLVSPWQNSIVLLQPNLVHFGDKVWKHVTGRIIVRANKALANGKHSKMLTLWVVKCDD